jgi:hypothetical protein
MGLSFKLDIFFVFTIFMANFLSFLSTYFMPFVTMLQTDSLLAAVENTSPVNIEIVFHFLSGLPCTTIFHSSIMY